jgi:hypothetical protein
MDWGQLKVREREFQETKIETGAIEGDDDGIPPEAIGQVLEVLAVDEHFIPVTVKKANHGNRVEDRRETSCLDVEENGLGLEFRKEPPRLAQS